GPLLAVQPASRFPQAVVANPSPFDVQGLSPPDDVTADRSAEAPTLLAPMPQAAARPAPPPLALVQPPPTPEPLGPLEPDPARARLRPGDGVRRGRDALAAARRAAPAAGLRGGDPRAALRGARTGPRARRGASGPEARERAGGREARRPVHQGHGLRHRQAA